MVRKYSFIGPVMVFISPALPILLYFQGDFSHLSDPFSLSMLAGIPAFVYLLNSVILSARLRVMDRLLGHDRVIILHRWTASAGIILGLTHWVIKSRVFPFYGLQNWLGLAAVCLFLLFSMGAFLFMAPGKLLKIKPLQKIIQRVSTLKWGDYSIMKALHNIMMTAIVMISIHVLLASSTNATWWRLGLMAFWAVSALFLWIFHKLLRPLYQKKRDCTVSLNISLTKKVDQKTIREIRINKGKFPPYKAGQFVFIKFPDHKDLKKEHPFTLSSAPSEDDLAVTIKDLGDYTGRLDKVCSGERALLDGPYGQFSLNTKKQKPLIFMAGGIGITPFYSIIKEHADSWKNPITLFWAVQSSEDLVYHKQLVRKAEECITLTYIPVIASTESSVLEYPHKTGFLTPEIVKEKLTGAIKDHEFFFCGPAPMFNALIPALKKSGIKRIHFERFTF